MWEWKKKNILFWHIKSLRRNLNLYSKKSFWILGMKYGIASSQLIFLRFCLRFHFILFKGPFLCSYVFHLTKLQIFSFKTKTGFSSLLYSSSIYPKKVVFPLLLSKQIFQNYKLNCWCLTTPTCVGHWQKPWLFLNYLQFILK